MYARPPPTALHSSRPCPSVARRRSHRCHRPSVAGSGAVPGRRYAARHQRAAGGRRQLRDSGDAQRSAGEWRACRLGHPARLVARRGRTDENQEGAPRASAAPAPCSLMVMPSWHASCRPLRSTATALRRSRAWPTPMARRTQSSRRSSTSLRCSAGSVSPASSWRRPASWARSDPTDDDIRLGLSGNLCRCTGYYPIMQAVRRASVVPVELDERVRMSVGQSPLRRRRRQDRRVDRIRRRCRSGRSITPLSSSRAGLTPGCCRCRPMWRLQCPASSTSSPPPAPVNEYGPRCATSRRSWGSTTRVQPPSTLRSAAGKQIRSPS